MSTLPASSSDPEVQFALRRTGFHAELEPLGDRVVLRLHGELDMATSPLLDRALTTMFNDSTTSVVIDLSCLTFLDSSGISMLLGAGRQAEAAGLDFLVRSPNRPVLKALRLTGVDRIIAIEADEA